MGPDPTQAYFWPTVNKRPTRLWPGYFLTQPEWIFLTGGKKIEKFGIFRRNFPNSNPNPKWLSQPNPTWATKNWPDPGQKFLTRTHHYSAYCIFRLDGCGSVLKLHNLIYFYSIREMMNIEGLCHRRLARCNSGLLSRVFALGKGSQNGKVVLA